MKKIRIPRESKTMVYFGQRTDKDEPFFALSQALSIWGYPGSSPSPAPRPTLAWKSAPVQGDLFALE